jgi:hypothetical protein
MLSVKAQAELAHSKESVVLEQDNIIQLQDVQSGAAGGKAAL